MTIRIGAVSYLNTKPLIFQLKELLPGCELILDLPSRLADRLAARDLDVALIPSVEYLRGVGGVIVSDACIACHGEVRSVRLIFRKPPQQIESLALDVGSRTSATLAQVLLAKRFGIRPKLQPLAIDSSLEETDADACLIIGDRAMNIATSPYCEVWDLGQEWTQETGLPFVFALWIAHTELAAPIVEAFELSRDAGLSNLDQIVSQEAPRYGLSEAACREYFQQHLYFYLGREELAGLQLFSDQAAQLGLIPEPGRIRCGS